MKLATGIELSFKGFPENPGFGKSSFKTLSEVRHSPLKDSGHGPEYFNRNCVVVIMPLEMPCKKRLPVKIL